MTEAKKPEWRETAGTVASIAALSRMVDMKIVNAIIAQGDRFDSVGPILDPTGWMRDGEGNRCDTRMFRAFRSFRATLDEIADEVEASRGR